MESEVTKTLMGGTVMKNVVGEVRIDLVRGEWFMDFFFFKYHRFSSKAELTIFIFRIYLTCLIARLADYVKICGGN